MAKSLRPAVGLPAARTVRTIVPFSWTRPAHAWKPFGRALNQHVGDKLYVLRVYNGKSQTEMGELCGLIPQQITKYEHGRSKIPPDKLWLIAAYFNLDINYFFDGFDPADTLPKLPVAPLPDQGSNAKRRLKIAAVLAKITSGSKLHSLIGLVRALADAPEN